jgi:hypothetical protein
MHQEASAYFAKIRGDIASFCFGTPDFWRYFVLSLVREPLQGIVDHRKEKGLGGVAEVF